MTILHLIIDLLRACCWRLFEWFFEDEPEDDLMIEADRPPRIIEDDNETITAISYLADTESGQKGEIDED